MKHPIYIEDNYGHHVYKANDIVFDDRPRVVKMWRENGVFVADVYQGTEDF